MPKLTFWLEYDTLQRAGEDPVPRRVQLPATTVRAALRRAKFRISAILSEDKNAENFTLCMRQSIDI